MTTPSLLPFGYEYTAGDQIDSATGTPVRIAAVNWFGFETGNFAPGGLDLRSYQSIMKQMVAEGFNAIRLPFSDQLFDPSSTPSNIDFNLNPDLVGKNGLAVMDAIVSYAGQIGLKIILDHHRSSAYSGPNGNGLWYDDGYSDARWIADWQMLATHYAGNSTVIGADLANEPHDPATWGDGSADDWKAAATRAGDAIQAINPNWLIFVQGVQTYAGQNTWWGSNLMGVASNPVQLTVSNHLVYEVHEYPPSVGYQTAFGDPTYPSNLYGLWNNEFGYIYAQGIAPVFVGEIGSQLRTTADKQYISTLVDYLNGDLQGTGASSIPAGGQGLSWGWWAWNPDSSDTGGIVGYDWSTVDPAKINAIQSAFYFKQSGASGASGSSTGSSGTSGATAPTYTPYTGGSAGNAAITLGDGNYAVSVSGLNDRVKIGNGSEIVGVGVNSPIGNATITLGSGNSTVIAFGTGNTMTAGPGNDVVLGCQGNSTVALAKGNQTVVLFGAGNQVTAGDTANPADGSQATFVNVGSGNGSVTVGDGTVFLLASGGSNVIHAGLAGSANSRAFVFLANATGAASVVTGGGDDWIVLGGPHNSVDAGTGGNVIYDGGGSNTYVLTAGGADYAYGFSAQSDRIDLTRLFNGAHLQTDLTTVSRYLQVAPGGNDALLRVDASGSGNFASTPVFDFAGQNALTLAQLLQASALVLPT